MPPWIDGHRRVEVRGPEVHIVATHGRVAGSTCEKMNDQLRNAPVDLGKLLSGVRAAIQHIVRCIGEVRRLLPVLAGARQLARCLFAIGEADERAHGAFQLEARDELRARGRVVLRPQCGASLFEQFGRLGRSYRLGRRIGRHHDRNDGSCHDDRHPTCRHRTLPGSMSEGRGGEEVRGSSGTGCRGRGPGRGPAVGFGKAFAASGAVITGVAIGAAGAVGTGNAVGTREAVGAGTATSGAVGVTADGAAATTGGTWFDWANGCSMCSGAEALGARPIAPALPSTRRSRCDTANATAARITVPAAMTTTERRLRGAGSPVRPHEPAVWVAALKSPAEGDDDCTPAERPGV